MHFILPRTLSSANVLKHHSRFSTRAVSSHLTHLPRRGQSLDQLTPSVVVPTGSYYGLIPRQFVDPLRQNFQLLLTKLKLELLSELIHSLSAGEHQVWCAVKCAISQVLQ